MASDCQGPDAGLQSEVSIKHKATHLIPWVYGIEPGLTRYSLVPHLPEICAMLAAVSLDPWPPLSVTVAAAEQLDQPRRVIQTAMKAV